MMHWVHFLLKDTPDCRSMLRNVPGGMSLTGQAWLFRADPDGGSGGDCRLPEPAASGNRITVRLSFYALGAPVRQGRWRRNRGLDAASEPAPSVSIGSIVLRLVPQDS